MTPLDLPPTKWVIRRTFMFIVCAICLAIACWLAYGAVMYDTSNPLAMALGITSLVAVITCVGSYVFGAAWEDIARLKVLGGSGDS